MSKRKGFDSSLGSVLGTSPTAKPSTSATEKKDSNRDDNLTEPKITTTTVATKAKKKSAATTPTAKRSVGRPRAQHQRIRFTSIVEQELRDKMKIIAIRKGIKINDAFNTALANYVQTYEKKNGEIIL